MKFKNKKTGEIQEFICIKINSSLLSAQNRERCYWTNIPGVKQPKDKGVLLKDIVLSDVIPVALHNLYGGFKEKSVRVFEGKSPTIRTAAGGGHIPSFVKGNLSEKICIAVRGRPDKNGKYIQRVEPRSDNKTNTLTTAQKDNMLLLTEKALEYMDCKIPDDVVVANFFKGVPYSLFKNWDCIRKFYPIECERLQTIDDNYTEGVSNTQRYKMIGNAWTVDVIAHILSHIKDY